jgi:DUF1009 family protein
MQVSDTDVAGVDASDPLAIICGGGSLPYVVAEAAASRGRRVVLFALRGWADPARVTAFPHHWIALGQAGRFVRLADREGCRDVVWIGSLVRPAITQIRLDIATLRRLPRILRAFRGGDDHLLSSLGRMFEEDGFRLRGAHEVAPQLLVPEGVVAGRRPEARHHADIVRALAILDAVGPFDIGQAAVVADQHCLALEGAEGTDGLLARIADMRQSGHVRTAPGTGVLVKAPKRGQDRRFDLPTIGPQTIEGVIKAGLGGVAVVAGSVMIADIEQLTALADRGGIFVVGVRSGETVG